MSTICGSGAMSPSMLKTPSVMTRMRPPSTSLNTSSKDARSACLYGLISARLKRDPSMMLAWFSSSETMVSPLPTKAGMTATFAINPDCRVKAASTRLNRATCLSSDSCRTVVPAMLRTAAGPTPKVSIASFAAWRSLGSLARPR